MASSLRDHIPQLPPLRALLTVDNAKNAVVVYVVFAHVTTWLLHLSDNGILGSVRELLKAGHTRLAKLMLLWPSNRRKADAGMEDARAKIYNSLVPVGPNVTRHLELPAQGRTAEWIDAEMAKMEGEGKTSEWKSGKISGAVYHGGQDMERIIVAAFQRYVVSNPLHPDVFPAVRKMEAEIVAMCLRMYNLPSGAGTTTSGGTESIILAVKTYRDWARDVKGIKHPEIVIPVSAHAAFDKAGAYLKIKVRHIAVDPETRCVDLKAMKRAINRNTIMIVGSAVNFPDGCMDDIVALGNLAEKRNVGLHVDCCLGSFIMPFLERAGFPCAPFDFRVSGVTSISCDTHKYGFAPKGSSVIMYRTAELRQYQYFSQVGWPGGLYASPSIAGSRPGSLIAGTWAAMQYMGQDGYVKSCKSIVTCARTIEERIKKEIPSLYILGKPVASVVAFGSHVHNMYQVGDRMVKLGWHLNALADPPALHIACTRLTLPAVEQFFIDLKQSLISPDTASGGEAAGSMVALYGIGATAVVGPALVQKVANIFLDALFVA